ncbi:MAG TPA: amino acid racemase [Ginsengibacter sp.]
MIGIVGGAGPFAGAELFRKIIEETDVSSDQEHVPVILWSVPAAIPDRTEYLEGRVKENPAGAISRIFLELQKAGATIAAIPCNTAHAPAIFCEVERLLKQAGSQLKIVNIVSETVRYLKQNFPKGSAVGVLSTTGTWRRRIYRQALEAEGFKVLDSESIAEQEQVHQAIYDKEHGVKAHSSPVTDVARNTLHLAAERLIKRGAEAVILGCTEIPLAITERCLMNVPMVDTLQILARSLIYGLSPEKLKKSD